MNSGAASDQKAHGVWNRRPGIGAHSTLVVVALLAAAVLRFALAKYSLWFDELASVFFASQPLSRLWSMWMVRETNPPLYYSLLHVWSGPFGIGIVSLRSLSIIASLIAAATIYAGTRVVCGRRSALAALVMTTASAQQLFYSQQVRAYMMLYLAVTVSFLGLMRIAQSSEAGTRRPDGAWAAYVGGSIAAVYLHTTGLLWPAVATLALMIASPDFRPFHGRYWVPLIVADILVLIGTAWWVGITYLQMRGSHQDLGWIPRSSPGELIWTLRETILLTRNATGWQQIAPVAVAALALFGFTKTRRRATTRLTMACLVIACTLFVTVSMIQPILQERTIFWISIFPLTLAATGIGAIADRRLAMAILASVAGLLCFNLMQSVPNLQNEDWSTPVAGVARDPNAVVLVDGEAMSVAFDAACAVELNRGPCPFPVIAVKGIEPDFDPWAVGYARRVDNPTDLQRLLAGNKRAYIFRRRRSQDVLIDLKSVGLLGQIPPNSQPLIGPLSSGFMPSLAERSYFDDGLLRLDSKRQQ